MFYSEAILSRRGPLARVWLAAHMERKLSKTQTLQTDIEESIGAIMGQEVEVMALRLSGQLLLGVVRIYSRKAKYLLDDCNEALLKIKMAFRPGLVDMTEEQLVVNQNAITLQEGNIDLDLLLPDINWDIDFDRPQQPQGQHVARMADITLATADELQFDLDDPSYGFDLGGDGIGSQDYDLDLGIDFGDGPQKLDEESMDVEVGRDAVLPRPHRDSLDSNLLGKNAVDDLDLISHRSREPSENNFEKDYNMDFGADIGGMDLDLGIDFGEGPSGVMDANAVPELIRSFSRASSRLTTPPPTPPAEGATDGVEVAEQDEQDTPVKAVKKKINAKKQIIDNVTEMENGPGARLGRNTAPADLSNIVTQQHFLPRSRSVMRLLEIRQDPLAHFLPTKVTANGTYFCAGPPGLAPELTEMFMRPIINILAPKKRGTSPEKSPNKRRRINESVIGEEEVEQGRRADSRAPSVPLGSDVFPRDSIGPGLDGVFDIGNEMSMPMDDYPMDADLTNANMDLGLDRERSRSRFTTPTLEGALLEEGEETYADASCPIAMFDDKQSQSQSQDTYENEGKGYSRNTVKALTVIRKELQPTVNGEEKVMSFRQISHKATRRAAASFFFELLVLGTRDCVKLSQPIPFENIEIQAKDKLWERQAHVSAPNNGPRSMSNIPV